MNAENSARHWDKVFNEWVAAGMPENDPKIPKPPPHPD